MIGRASAARRQRRLLAGPARLFCSTNGCASFLEIVADRHEAVCPVCGFRRRLN